MINVQAAGFSEELLKIATQERFRTTAAGMPFPDNPGPTYKRRFFGDALAIGMGTTAGMGLSSIALQALKDRGVRMDPRLRGIIRGVGPMVAGAGGAILGNIANDMRKQRLIEAARIDEKKRLEAARKKLEAKKELEAK